MKSFNQSVMVYSFRCFDIDAGASVVPPFKATQEAIKHSFRGEILPLTGELVEVDELDNEGRWFRMATGWGELK
jgi:hypothetical protein